MKIAIFSEANKDAREGTLQLLTKYASKSPEVIFPVTEDNITFATSVANLCKQLGIPTTAYTEHDFTLADESEESLDAVIATIYQLQKGDAVGIMWTDSEEDHFVLHSVEDLALDVWDITEGLAAIESHDIAGGLDPERLRDAMMEKMEDFIDLLSAYVATSVMESLGKAVAEHIAETLDKKDISPFGDEE